MEADQLPTEVSESTRGQIPRSQETLLGKLRHLLIPAIMGEIPKESPEMTLPFPRPHFQQE